MPKTVANQKWIRVHKSPLVYNFLSVPNNEWMTANKTLTPYGLQLYLYLAANMDGYQFALSPEDAERAAGIRRTTFYEYLRKMEIHGYLVWRGGSTYDFYTSPRPEDKRTHPDKHASEMIVFDDCPCNEQAQFAQQEKNPHSENGDSLAEPICSHGSIEINNKYGDRQQEIMINMGAVSADAEPDASTGQRVIVIPPPQSKPKFVF